MLARDSGSEAGTNVLPGRLLRREIRQQSSVASEVLKAAMQCDLASLLDRPGVMLAGRGSSGAAALYGASVLTLYAKRPAHEISPSLLGFYRPELDLSESVLVAISQSGASGEVVEAASWARSCGAKVVAVTNHVDSPLASGLPAEQVLLMRAGEEQAVPATKTFTASLVWLLALALAPNLQPLLSLPAWMDGWLERDYSADVRHLAGVSTFYFVGEGVAASVAREGALKFREMLGVAAVPLETSDLLHGSTAALDERSAVIGVAGDETGAFVLAQARKAWEARGARCLCLTAGNGHSADEVAMGDLLAPSFPVVAILQLQLVALGLAVDAGRDPDHPAGLSKLTETVVPRRTLPGQD